MRPTLFEIPIPEFLGEWIGYGSVPGPAYFVMLLLGFSFATALAVVWGRRIGLDPDRIVDLSIVMLIMGVIGGRIFHVLFDGYFWDYVHLCTDPGQVDWNISRAACLSERYNGEWDAVKRVCHPTQSDCFAWAYFWAGGLVYYGGLVFSVLTAIWMCKRDKLPIWKVADVCGVAIALGLGFGRMGCLLAGCCFGITSDSSLALSFPPYSPASDSQFKAELISKASEWSLPVHATQAYEAAAAFAVAGFCLIYVRPRKRYDGEVILWTLSLYAIARFLLEIIRADDRGGVFGLSTSQWIAVCILVGCYLVHRWRVRGVFVPQVKLPSEPPLSEPPSAAAG